MILGKYKKREKNSVMMTQNPSLTLDSSDW